MAAPTLAEITAALLPTEGNAWTSGQVTYSFPRIGSLWPGYAADEEQNNADYSAPSEAQNARFRLILDAWDKTTGLRLVETDDLSATGQIRIAFTDIDDFEDDAVAYAYYPPRPGFSPAPWSGDIWLDDSMKDKAFADRSPEYFSLLHEIGHALGLKHSFEDGAVLPTAYDTTRYSVMSYTGYQDAYYITVELIDGVNKLIGRVVTPTTPMVFDIAALQARYGADPTTDRKSVV